MGKIQFFRLWFYLRTGYQLYFAFIFAVVNTLTITYFLAIERAPSLQLIFPSFVHYAVVLLVVGLPILVAAGFLHFKRIPAFKSEQEIAVESNPFIYKLTPGHAINVLYPYHLILSKLILKIGTNEKLSEDEINEMKEIQKKMDHLVKGGFVGLKKGKTYPFAKDNQ